MRTLPDFFSFKLSDIQSSSMSMHFRTTRKIYEFFMLIFSRVFSSFAAVRVIVVEEGKVLAVDQGSYLELPGGAVEYEETLEEAAIREVKEETGVEVELKDTIENSEFGKAVEVMFEAETNDVELEGSWEGKPIWIPVEDINDRKWRYSRNVEEIVERII